MASKDSELVDLTKTIANLNEKLEGMSNIAGEKEVNFKEVLANHSLKEKSLQKEIEELRNQLDQVKHNKSFDFK